MRTQITPILLLTLLRPSNTVAASDAIGLDQPCLARAWVRAPDLEPGQVVQGDVKVKLDGACADVSSYTLRLRFAERAWVKTRRADVQLPERPVSNNTFLMPKQGQTILDPDPFWRNRSLRMEPLAWDQYHDEIKNPALWFMREEERIGFETTYKLPGEKKDLGHNVVQAFAILVPNTNYPPAFDPSLWVSTGYDMDSSDSEHIYSYFVDIAFMDDTILEVQAGFTSFNPQAVATLLPETVNVTVDTWPLKPVTTDGETSEDVDNFTLEVTFPHGRHLEQGSVNNIIIISHQIGPGIEHLDGITWLTHTVSHKRHWAAALAIDNETAECLLNSGRYYNVQLKPTNPSIKDSRTLNASPVDSSNELLMFPQDRVVTNGSMFSTKPVTAQIRIPENCYPSFVTHYHTTEIELSISLRTQNVSSSSQPSTDDSDDYDWIPTMKQTNTLSLRSHKARIPVFVYSKQDDPTRSITTEAVHYLSPEARAPTFVDPASIEDLLQKPVKERDALAPKAQPHFITRDGDDIVSEKYFARNQKPGMYYVGNTWLRKVILPSKKNEQEVGAQSPV